MKIAAALLLTLPAVSLAQQIAVGEYMLPINSSPYGITAGPDGAMWFTGCRHRGPNDWGAASAA